jgi:hypothetical protein
MNCKGCGKDITGLWSFAGYGWCCVQHWHCETKDKSDLDELKGYILGLIIVNIILIASIVYDKIF